MTEETSQEELEKIEALMGFTFEDELPTEYISIPAGYYEAVATDLNVGLRSYENDDGSEAHYINYVITWSIADPDLLEQFNTDKLDIRQYFSLPLNENKQLDLSNISRNRLVTMGQLKEVAGTGSKFKVTDVLEKKAVLEVSEYERKDGKMAAQVAAVKPLED